MPQLTPIPFGGIRALEADELIPLDAALVAQDCILDDGTIRPRSGSRAVMPSALGGDGDSVQGLWHFRPSPTSAVGVAVAGGTVYIVTSPTTSTASDATATSIGSPFGVDDAISGTQLGRHFYLASDSEDNIWRRINWDSLTDTYSLEVIESLGVATGLAYTTSSLDVVVYDTDLSAPTATGGAVAVSSIPYPHWYTLTGPCPVGGAEEFVLPDSTGTGGSGESWSGFSWLAAIYTPPTASDGGGHVGVSIATASGGYEHLGEMFDGPGGGSPNVLYLPLTGITAATRAAVKKIKFDLTGAAGNWGIYGHMVLPVAPGNGTVKYFVTFRNSSSGARSAQSEELVATLTTAVVIPTYHSVWSQYNGFVDSGDQSLDPSVIPPARFGNKNIGTDYPKREEFAGVPQVTGDIPTSSQYPLADKAELWRLTDTGYRLAKTQTLTGGETTFSLTDDQGDLVLSNEAFIATGSPTRTNALAAYGARLIAGYENQVHISSYIAPTATSDPFPDFPPIATEDFQGSSFDIAASNAEQIQVICTGDATYILTQENCFFLSALTPLTVPDHIFNRGCIGRRGAIYAENLLFWCGYDGIYTAANRTGVEEMTKSVRRLYIDWLLPDCAVVLAYSARKLHCYQDDREIRFDFTTGSWTRHTLGFTVRHAAAWTSPTIA